MAGNAFSQSKTISGGNDHGLIICAQGYLYTWGNNMDKTIGGPLLGIDPDGEDGAQASADVVYKPSRVKTDGLTFSMVTSGSGAFNLALSCYKVVYGWGDNQQSGCGQGASAGNVIKYPSPVLKGETEGYTVDGKPGGDYLGGVTYIAASTNSGFAIMKDGRVVGWGKGAWNAKTGAAASEPSYIKTKDGKDLTNVTHISGGDDNCLIRTSDGSLYGIGPWNGQSETAVKYAVPVLKEEDGTPLTDIRMSAAGDVCGFAVTGDGYVWSWGNGGWGGSTGQQKQGLTHYSALKVSSGEYSTISGEEYLTDVKEVIGGRGHGAAVTKEGYLVYWGCDDGNGGVAPVGDATATKWASGAQGVLPVLARYCDASGKPGPLVDNAVSISRGDNFDFMVNDKDEYYVWGLNDLGQAGTGNSAVKSYTCLTKLTTIPCEIQDNCPTVFMIDRIKCPGEEIELDCGYVVPKGKEDRYFITWWFNDKLLNTSKKTDSKADRLADKFNKASIFITEPGKYKVKVEYIGANIPCDACDPDSTTITVEDMAMPVDTVITSMNCVAEPLSPAASDVICYEFSVNSDFYKADQKTTFAAFSTEDSKDTLDVFSSTGGGAPVKFCVTGDKIGKTEVHDNKDEESKDTTYTVWIEDISSFETYLFKDSKGSSFKTGGSFQSYGLMIDAYADADLKSFDIAAKSYSGSASISVTPTVYLAAKNTNGQYVVGDVFWKGKAQTFTIDDAGPNVCTVKCDVRLPGSPARGVRYIIGMALTGNCTLYNFDAPKTKQNSPEFTTPIIDSEEFGIFAFGATANSYTSQSNGSDKLCYANVLFGKLTDYDCGRIKLTAKYGCPPCNQPDGIVKIASTVEAENDTIFLCKETGSTTLSVDKIAKASEPTASFDILWFKKPTMLDADALKADAEASSSSIDVAWEDVPAGTSQKYYLKIRDHEKPEASSCWVIDSVIVKANKVPTVPLIEIDPFCEGKLSDADAEEIAGNVVNLNGLKIYSLKNEAGADVSAQAALAADIAALTAGEHSYTIQVEDAVTGCLSEDSTFVIKVNAVPEVPAVNDLSMLKELGSESVESGATASAGCTINWFTSKDLTDGSTTAPKQDKGVAGTYTYYVSQTSEDGCESDTTHFTVTVNDAPKPNTRDTIICKGELIDLVSRVTRLNDTYLLNWYTTEGAEKGTGSSVAPDFSETTPGVYTYYVSQTSTETKAESEKASFNVTVIGVDPATVVIPETTYCKGEPNPASVATMVTLASDESKYIYADATGMVWSNESGSVLTAAQLIPETNVELTTSSVYTVYQTYTIPSSAAVCKGEPVSVTVNVTVVDAPKGELAVNYLKSDAADNGGKFVDVLTKNPAVVTPDAGCTLIWHDAAGNVLPSAPAPAYDPNQSEDVEVIYYVSQKDANGCESELSKVLVTISSAPMPTPNHVAYCAKDADAKTTALTANIQTTGTGDDKESDYQLVWYGQTNPNELSNAEKEALESTTAPFPANEITDGSTKQVFTYYVAQKSIKSGAVSRAVAVCDTVYAAPVLVTNNPSPVCEPATVDLSSKEIWKDAVPQNWVMAWLDDTKSNPLSSPTSVAKSGTYYAQAYFKVQGKECVSNLAEINVEVHYIRGLEIEGSNTTCPDNGVELTAKYDEINPDAQAKFKWTCVGAGDDPAPIANVVYGTPNLKGPAGNTYTYTLTATAGACVDIAGGNHLITIGDGPVEGNVKFDEVGNTGSTIETVTEKGLTFYSCGKPITIDLSGVKSDGEFTWSLAGGVVGTGATYTIAAPENATYHVEYINNCKTGFDINIINVPVNVVSTNTSVEVCDGDDFKAELNVACVENTYKIAWFQDGVELVGESAKVLSFSPATPANNGVYSYKVTNRGCTAEGEIAEGKAVKVKPYIEFDVQKEYIVRSGDPVSVPLKVTVPAAGEPSTIEWYESGVTFASGNPLSISAVTADHNLNVKLSDADYCASEGNVVIRKDARLQLKVSLEDQMCASDVRELVIDTTGTGKFIFPGTQLYIIETVAGVETKIEKGWMWTSTGLRLNVSPASDATYDVYFIYREGEPEEQREKVSKSLKVLPPVQIELPTDLKLCANGENDFEVSLVSVSPSGTLVTWEDDESIISGHDGNSITINPVFDETKYVNSYYKDYVVHASYSICSEIVKHIAVRVDRPLTGEIVAPEVICESSYGTIDASSYGAETYSWSSYDDPKFPEVAVTPAVIVAPENSASYGVEMTRGECTAEDDWSIIVSEKPEIVSVDSIGFHSREIQVSGGATPYSFVISDVTPAPVTNSLIENIPFGEYTVLVTDAAGCSTVSKFLVRSPGLDFQPILSPNGDGVFDVFSSEILRDAYPNSVVTIFDRWGKKLVQYNGSEPGWDGTYNGKPMPSTDYWYEVEIKELQKTYTGHFTLMRQ